MKSKKPENETVITAKLRAPRGVPPPRNEGGRRNEAPKTYTIAECQRHIRFWSRQLEILGVNTSDVNAKEKEAEKRELPPTPPIERKGEEKEAANYSTARAHACDDDTALTNEELRLLQSSLFPEDQELHKRYMQNIPTLNRAISHASLRGFNDAEFIKQWYTAMEMGGWLDRHGKNIENWGKLLMRWFAYRNFFDKLQDPNRIPDASRVSDATYGASMSNSKPINWRGTRKEDLDDILG